jgi:DMSO/TMAO reductase YedYZ molybdopterin-dependent catalytic subunit
LKKLFIIAAVAATLLSACAAPQASPSPAAMGGMPAATLPPDMAGKYRAGELMEYDGTRLDPAIAPVKNSIKGVQHVDISTYTLAIDGLVQNPQQYTYGQVTALPSDTRLVTLRCVEGWDVTILWKGVTLKDLLKDAEVQPEARTVIFHAVDGYTTSLPLQEILDRNLMLGYEANGLPLPPEMGYPFIFVAEDKWGYKWARWVDRIELSPDTNYKGYWEQYGYSNEGDIN